MLPDVREASLDGAEVRLVTADAVATVRALLGADPALTDLRIHDASLEDAIAVLLTTDEKIAA